MEGTVNVYECNKLNGFSWRKLCETVSILPSGENMLPTLQLFFDPFLALVIKKVGMVFYKERWLESLEQIAMRLTVGIVYAQIDILIISYFAYVLIKIQLVCFISLVDFVTHIMGVLTLNDLYLKSHINGQAVDYL